MDLKICDDNGNELPVGEKGEIVIRGGNVMHGYWRNETATHDAIRDGWLYTGDMGYVTQDGFVITSYSIHYTKLYECHRKLRRSYCVC